MSYFDKSGVSSSTITEGGEWTYLSTTNPSGLGNPTAVYQFDGTADQLDDRMATGNDLSLLEGTQANSAACGLVGLGFDAPTRYGSNDNGAQELNEVTVEALILPNNPPPAGGACGTICCHGKSGASAIAYKVNIGGVDGGILQFAFHEGWPLWALNTLSPNTGILYGQLQLIQVVRELTTENEVYAYVNGVLCGHVNNSKSSTGDAGARLYIGGNESAPANFSGIIFSIRITGEAFTAAQCLEAYRQVRCQ